MTEQPKRCGAKTRSGKPCQSPAMANGRCRMHGGKSLGGVDSPTFKHGRYSRYLPEHIQAKAQSFDDADALNLLPELQVQRALFADYISRFQVGVPLSANDIALMMDWSAEIGRTVERVVKMRNDTALTGAELKFIAARIADVVAKFIDEPDEQRRFVSALLAVVGEPTGRNRSALASGNEAR